MSRSVKKGPFVQERLLKRIEAMNEKNEKIGHKLGEFAPTRTYRGHVNKSEKSSSVKR